LEAFPEFVDREAVRAIGESGDPRLAWLLSDVLRFLLPGQGRDDTLAAFTALTGVEVDPFNPWVEATNLLIGWEVPAPPTYREWKGDLYTSFEPRWAPFFDDPESSLDYRTLYYGGVGPDDRPLGWPDAACEGGCIAALDDPGVTLAGGGDWYPDDGIVFGIAVDGVARAYPKNIMEVHEMVIDTVGATRIGMPYCTLCGTAQAYDLGAVPADIETLILRTSGLLVRSNKLVFDLVTWSAIDMFSGRAVTGPLRGAGLTLARIPVVTTTWGAWKMEHPDTTIVAADGGIGRSYPEDPLGGRDRFGPIFPVGPIDVRLPAQTQVLGVEAPGGAFVAFPVDQAVAALAAGEAVRVGDVEAFRAAGGLRARLTGGEELVGIQSFWFAWSQFHRSTDLWVPGG
ncbi:MAG: DUF3179 domain-containing protein, partial [Acidimicrobiia bacterium]|nr:DUF3179 domain-containing protein [Acidimicrobiia bacterium]